MVANQHDRAEANSFALNADICDKSCIGLANSASQSCNRMAMSEEYEKTRLAYEHFLNSLSEEERKLHELQLKHADTFCTLDGEYILPSRVGENLFEVIRHKQRFLVDSNFDWKRESAKLEHKDKAFIVGKTVVDEHKNFKGLFFSPSVSLENKNVFILSPFSFNNQFVVRLERLDEYFRYGFDEHALDESSKPRSTRADSKSAEYHAMFKAGVEHERKAILLLFGIGDIKELAEPSQLGILRQQFREFIRLESPNCSGRYIYAAGVARHCYALLLAEVRRMRSEFAESEYLNVFGDTRIIQNALFLQSAILSNDGAVKRMARYAGLDCQNKLP